MRLQLRIAAAIALLAATGPACSQGGEREASWERLSADDQGEYFYDPQSVSRSGNRVGATVRLLPSGPTASGSSDLIARLDFDCASQTAAFVSARAYGDDGELLRSTSLAPEQVRPFDIFAGSEFASFYEAVCPNGRPLPGPPPPPVATPPGSAAAPGDCGEQAGCGDRGRDRG